MLRTLFKIWSGSVKQTQILINLFNWQSAEEERHAHEDC
jgi:hypothetical protein